jgi:hypothetical protein
MALLALSDLDQRELFSMTLLQSQGGYCVGVQRFAGDLVHYETRRVMSDAITAAVDAVSPAPVPSLAPPPY